MNIPARRNGATFQSSVRSLLSGESGNVAIVFSVAAIPLVIAAGGVTDYALASLKQRSLQEALDAAVLAGISGQREEEEEIAVAEAYFLANRPQDWDVQDVSFSHHDGTLTGTAVAEVPTRFLRIAKIPVIEIGAQSAATKEDYREPVCVMAMHPHRKHTLELKGSVSVVGSDCHFYGNSSHPDDVVDPHNDENYLTGKSVQAIGYGHHYLENVSPPLEYAPELIADPLADMTIPEPGGCDFTDTEINGGAETLSPGTYCGGLKIHSAKVTLDPGTYLVADDDLSIEASTVTGEGVTIVLADNHVELAWVSSIMRLSAPTEGSNAGIVMMGVRQNAVHVFENSTIDLEGVVYLPDGEVEWTNTGTPAVTADWTVWIVDGFSWDGDGTITINFRPDDSDVPYPDKLRFIIPRPGEPRLLY